MSNKNSKKMAQFLKTAVLLFGMTNLMAPKAAAQTIPGTDPKPAKPYVTGIEVDMAPDKVWQTGGFDLGVEGVFDGDTTTPSTQLTMGTGGSFLPGGTSLSAGAKWVRSGGDRAQTYFKAGVTYSFTSGQAAHFDAVNYMAGPDGTAYNPSRGDLPNRVTDSQHSLHSVYGLTLGLGVQGPLNKKGNLVINGGFSLLAGGQDTQNYTIVNYSNGGAIIDSQNKKGFYLNGKFHGGVDYNMLKSNTCDLTVGAGVSMVPSGSKNFTSNTAAPSTHFMPELHLKLGI